LPAARIRGAATRYKHLQTALAGIVLSVSGMALGQSIFESTPANVVAPKAPTTRPAEAGFVAGASQQTMRAKYQEAIAMLGKAMETASGDGQTVAYEALKAKQAEFQQLEEKLMAERMLPSIYPMELGKKGCLMAIREMQVAGAESLHASVQMVSWFQLKVTATDGTSLVSADVYDASGHTRLYHVRIDGPCAAQMPAGATVRLKNSVFDCTGEEGEWADKVYSLKQLDLSSFLKQ
jgi:hypothetical protein